MEVRIISKDIVKPSSPATQQKKPYKLCLFDQLTPTTYTPAIFFYSLTNDPSNNNNMAPQISAHLKKSLSETLNLYYPFSGRTTGDNMFIDGFDQGVPFYEALVGCRLSDFLKHHENVSLLNHFLPFQPFTQEPITNSLPVVAFQVSFFTCGSIALGWSASHKLVDGQTGGAFMSTWAALSRGRVNEVVHPDLDHASLFFPPRNSSLLQNHLSLMESLWFTEANYFTRRFVFDAKAIATIRAKAKNKAEEAKAPSRVEALSCFIWKCCMNASKKTVSVSGGSSTTTKPSILVEALNLRPRTKPPMSDASLGDIFWWATAVANPTDTASTELPELANLLRDAIALYDTDYTQSLQGEQGFETISDYCDQLEGLFSLEKPDIFAFTSWCHLGFTRLNFGWGEPVWFAAMGKVGPAFRNLTIFVETKDDKGIEAWITLDEERMSILERDPEFLAFASPDPRISSL